MLPQHSVQLSLLLHSLYSLQSLRGPVQIPRAAGGHRHAPNLHTRVSSSFSFCTYCNNCYVPGTILNYTHSVSSNLHNSLHFIGKETEKLSGLRENVQIQFTANDVLSHHFPRVLTCVYAHIFHGSPGRVGQNMASQSLTYPQHTTAKSNWLP